MTGACFGVATIVRLNMVASSSTARPLNPKAIEWFGARGIEPETVINCGIYTARHAPRGDGEEGYKEPIPDAKGSIIVFPFDERGEEVNAKFREQKRDRETGAIFKKLWQRPGGRKTFWGSDILDDPALTKGTAALVITEGEPDRMVVIQCGHPWAVSAPDGAPADVTADGRPIPMKPEAEIDPDDDAKFAFIWNNWERLQAIKTIIIATDNDGPGMRLRDEIVRRLGKVRCKFVVYPHQDKLIIEDERRIPGTDTHEKYMRAVKDLNEVLTHYGPEEVLKTIQSAKPYPVSGLYTLDDFEEVRFTTYPSGFEPLDPYIKHYEGCLFVWTGLAASGKSAVATQFIFNQAALHGWPAAIASFEAMIKPFMRDKLRHFILMKDRRDWTARDIRDADDFIRANFCFINRDPETEDDVTVDWLLERAADAVVRFGIKSLLVDPWNEVDHKKDRGEMRDEYVARQIMKFKDFAKRYQVQTHIVVHGTKEAAKTVKAGEPMSLYDTADGAMWANKADFGIVVHRNTPNDVMTRVMVKKVKHHRIGGVPGDAWMTYDPSLEMFVG